jgi:hypothetical protein
MKGSLLGQPPWGKLSASGSALALAPTLRLHLVQAGKGAHVPWRDSKLTRLLQDSLGGNSRSAIVVTLRDEVENIDETLGT